MIEKTRVIWSGAAASATLSRTGLDFAPEVDVIETSDYLGNAETVYRLRLRGQVPSGSEGLRFDFTMSTENAEGAEEQPSQVRLSHSSEVD